MFGRGFESRRFHKKAALQKAAFLLSNLFLLRSGIEPQKMQVRKYTCSDLCY